jgi:hypothetical protein
MGDGPETTSTEGGRRSLDMASQIDTLQCMHDVYGVDERQNKKRKLYGKHEAMRVCLRMAMSNDEDGRTTVMAAAEI